MTHAIIAPQYGEPSILEFAEVALPPATGGHVTIEVRAAGVNPADLKQLRGQFGRNEGSLPLRLGSEVSGVVTAVGEGVDGVAVGDEVVGFRVQVGYSEAITVKASAVLPKPSTLGWEEAAGLLATGVTAFHLLEATGVRAGDRVLVHGASGGVGLAAVQLCLLRGATVVGTAGENNQELVRGYGADPVVHGEGLLARVRELLPDGADVALDTVGTDEAIDVSVAVVKDHSRIATIGAYQKAQELGLKALGAGPGADPGNEIRMAARPELLRLAGAGKLDVRVARTFPLSEAAAALELIGTGHPGGKLILLP